MHHQLLPYMDQANLWNRWQKDDFNANRYPWAGGGYDYSQPQWTGDHFFKQAPPYLVCPSNPAGPLNAAADGSSSGRYAITSYFGCAGFRGYPRSNTSRPSHQNSDLNPRILNGMWRQNIRRKIRDCTDGTSNTIFMAERQIYDPVFDSIPEERIADWGWTWFGAQGDCFLGTGVKINFRLPANFFSLDSGTQALLYDDRINAMGSMHAGGCHVAMTDGSVRFLSENISSLTFLALGSMANGEVVGEF